MDSHLWVSWAALQAVLQLFPVMLGLLFSLLGVGLMLGVAIQSTYHLGEAVWKLSIVVGLAVLARCIHIMARLVSRYEARFDDYQTN